MERLDQDDVCVHMVYEHDEVVAAAGADGESAHVVGVELANGLYPNIELFGIGGRVRWRRRRLFGWRCGLGGSDDLLRLFYVTLEGFYGERAVLGRVGGGEAWPGSVVTCFDVCQPG